MNVHSIRSRLSAAVPAVEQYSISGNNFLYSLVLPVLMPLSKFGQFAYFLTIYYFAIVVWESVIVDPWILNENAKTKPTYHSQFHPPFASLALLLGLAYGSVILAISSASVTEAATVVGLCSISLWRIFARRLRFQDGAYAFLFKVSVLSIGLRYLLLFLVSEKIDPILALIIYFASDSVAILVDLSFLRKLKRNFLAPGLVYLKTNAKMVSNLIFQQTLGWLHPFSINTLTVYLLSYDLVGLLKIISNLTLPIILLNKNLLHQFLKSYAGNERDYYQAAKHYIRIAAPYALANIAGALLLGPLYLAKSTRLETGVMWGLLTLAVLNIGLSTVTSGLKSNFSKTLNLGALSRHYFFLWMSGILSFLLLYSVGIHYAPILADQLSPLFELVLLLTIHARYFKNHVSAEVKLPSLSPENPDPKP